MTVPALPADLATVLARAAAHGTDGRRIAAATPEEAQGALLDAIAACIAPRALTVRDGDSLLIRAEAVSGKLTRLHETAGGQGTGLAERPLQAADLDGVAGLLARLLPGEQLLTVTPHRRRRRPIRHIRALTCAT